MTRLTHADEIATRLFWAEECIKAYRTALDSLAATRDSDARLLLSQIDRRFPDFKPKTIEPTKPK